MKLKDMAIKGAGDRLLFDLDMIYEKPGYNARDMNSHETQAHIRRMADSIKENGTDTFPEITVFQESDKVYVHRGHCRLRAFKLARSEGAPVIGIRVIAAPKLDDAEHDLDMLNNADGLALTPIEQAGPVGRLVNKFGWPPEMVAKKRGCSVTTIKDLLKLLETPEEVKNMVRNGEVAARMATDVIRKEGVQKGTETLKKAIGTAKAAGKEKATAKHLPKTEPEQEAPKVNKTPEPPKKPTTVAVPKPSVGTDWSLWGPRMHKLLIHIRDVENIGRLQELQAQVGPFLNGIK